MIGIRAATSTDKSDVRDVMLSAFPEDEAPLIAELAVNLLDEDTVPETMTLVAESDGAVVGAIGFSPVGIGADKDWQGYILAPLGVAPRFQKRGIGSQLVQSGLARLSTTGINVLFVYGDPGYYTRFGFRAEAAAMYSAPYELQYPFGWQAITFGERSGIDAAASISCVASLLDPALW